MRLLTAQRLIGLLRGEVPEARSDLEEAMSQGGAEDETVAMDASFEIVEQGLSKRTAEVRSLDVRSNLRNG